MTTLDELNERIAAVLPEVTDFRHALHRIPEIAGQEFQTSALIRRKLEPLNLEIREPYLKTDVTALLNPDKKGNLTLRADMDALPLEEFSAELPYRSEHPGMMHACGHDGHCAMLYGAAKILAGIREQIPVSVRFLFQPGEEMACLSKALMEAGALRNPEPDFITGLHIWPNEPYGRICTKPGILMAAAGFFRIILHGKGGHGSLPELANNPIDCAAEIISACAPLNRGGCVLTFCHCHAGANNIVIPDTMTLEGTVRFTDPGAGRRLLKDFQSAVEKIAERRGIVCGFSCPTPYAPVINRPEDYSRIRHLVTENAGADAFAELPNHTMSSEDFSWYLQKYRGVFCHIGAGELQPLHSSRFDFDDRLLSAGIRYFCLTALKLFSSSGLPE